MEDATVADGDLGHLAKAVTLHARVIRNGFGGRNVKVVLSVQQHCEEPHYIGTLVMRSELWVQLHPTLPNLVMHERDATQRE